LLSVFGGILRDFPPDEIMGVLFDLSLVLLLLLISLPQSLLQVFDFLFVDVARFQVYVGRRAYFGLLVHQA
jgi:hypothetical protein